MGESYEQAMELLKELVLDAGETVTYRRLASALCMHVNRSKQILQKFVDDQKVNDIKATVLICGSNTTGNSQILQCPYESINKVRDSMNCVFYEHIYAVSRANAALEDSSLVNTLAGFDDLTLTIGVISSKDCMKLSEEEISNLKCNSYKTISQNVTSETNKSQNKDKGKTISNGKIEVKKEVKSENGIKKDVIGDNSETIVKELAKKSENTEKVKEVSKGKSKNNISNFFSKSNNTQANKTNVIEKKQLSKQTEEIKNPIKEEKTTIQTKCEKEIVKKEQKEESQSKITSSNSKREIKEEPKKVKKESNTKEKANSKKSKVVHATNGKVDKKRKRVLQMSDSDSDDPFEETVVKDEVESDEDIIPPTPNADVVKITSGILNPRKRRKLVDKTYTTEDGYMVTRKEEVLESCSEDESELKENIVETKVKKEVVEKKPASVVKGKKKIPSPQKGKQASIMSFFQKK